MRSHARAVRDVAGPVLAAIHRIREIAGNQLQDGRVQEEFSQWRRLGKEHLIGEVVGNDGVVVGELRQP